ncbi:MAG: hypothetical protein MUP22_12120 [Desulfobacterales bacterium]|nr:hypothetical protein [Desulfobacterales bacterium]
MGSIKTTKDIHLELTTNLVKDQITYDDLLNWTTSYYSGTVTKFLLWDFTEADLSNITTEEFKNIAEVVKIKSDLRDRGKSALVFSRDLEFGLGRMFEVFSKLEGTQFEFQSFRNIEEAKKWLGV